jgi:hypothetical protein
MRWSVVISLKRFTLIGIAAFSLSLVAPAVAEDRMVLGPLQQKEDKTGAGAVLCVWTIFLSVQAQTAACALPRWPVDDAYDQAIVAIDEFILANSSLHPTRPMLESFKRDLAAGELSSARQWRGPDFCKNSDLEAFRSFEPKKIQAWVRSLLAVPREPVMNPCL